MSAPTINGNAILSLCLTMPPSGPWHAKVESDADELVGAVTLDDDEGNVFHARVRRGDVVAGRHRAQIVGGAGKLADGTLKVLEARHFRGVTVRTVVSEILAQASETLATSSESALLNRPLNFWTIGPHSIGAALRALVEPLGGTWRVLADGTVWIGTDTYPQAPEQDRFELNADDAIGVVRLAADALSLRPGVTLDGRRVGQVQHLLTDEGRRTDYWYV
jgi:hypothetical protein